MPPLRFAVLKAGTAVRPTRERVGDFDRLFLDLLADPGEAWDVHDVEHGHFPGDPAAYDGYVITGSPASAYDDLPWVNRLCGLVRDAHGRGQALLGVCFGHQVLGRALGGEVAPNPRGWDVGVQEVYATAAAAQVPGLAEAPQPLHLLELHRDVVVRLPPGAVHLASSHMTSCEMFSLGPRTLGLQGHPELDAEAIREALVKLTGSGLLTAAEAERSAATLSTGLHRDFMRGWLRGFLRAGRLTQAAPVLSIARV